jgi:broad specificity phosphatase PhoE
MAGRAHIVEGEPGSIPFSFLWRRRWWRRSPGRRLVLVRHGMPAVVEGMPPSQWGLAPERLGDVEELARRLALGPDATVVASDERKALETAEVLTGGRAIETYAAFGEVDRPWFEDSDALRRATAEYLDGAPLEGWEPLADAVARFDRGLAALAPAGPLVVVTHGTVMTAWLAAKIGLPDPAGFWEALQTPDAYPVTLSPRS